MESIIIFFGIKGHLIVISGALFTLILLTYKQRVSLLYRALIALPLAFLSGRLLSLLVGSPRPFVVEQVTPLIDHVADNGFPSEHTLLVATVAFLIWTEHRVIGTVLAMIALLVGASRILAKVHHSIDVGGSIAIALTSVVLAYTSVEWLRKRHVKVLSTITK
jgi:undecaprenyl-diphosphatase